MDEKEFGFAVTLPGEVESAQAYEMDTPASRILADLFGISQDLAFVVEATQKLLDGLRTKLDPTVGNALWSSALVAYARCFVGGIRAKLYSQDVSRISAELLERHEFFINTRNKHVAHSVNAFEQVKIGVMITPKGEWIAGPFGMTRGVGEIDVVETLNSLADALLGNVRDRAEHHVMIVLEEATVMGIDLLHERPLIFQPPKDADVNKRRL